MLKTKSITKTGTAQGEEEEGEKEGDEKLYSMPPTISFTNTSLPAYPKYYSFYTNSTSTAHNTATDMNSTKLTTNLCIKIPTKVNTRKEKKIITIRISVKDTKEPQINNKSITK